MTQTHPRLALFGALQPQSHPNSYPHASALAACEHIAGSERHMRKALQLQAETGLPFDVTLNLQARAPLGGDTQEILQAQLIRELLDSANAAQGAVGVRLLPTCHRDFADTAGIVLRARARPAYLVCASPQGLIDVQRAADVLGGLGAGAVPLHVLIETHDALRDVAAIAKHPRVASLAFGLTEFVANHRGAIPSAAIAGSGQFDHPLVVRAKLEIAAACHAAGKTPSHNACAEIADAQAVQAAADMASNLLGYTRMCSIHPAQIAPILSAFMPSPEDVETAIDILQRAQAANWQPIAYEGRFQDHASYRSCWYLLESAARSGAALPADVRANWFAPA